MVTLEHLLSAADKARLIPAVDKRTSCYSYGEPVTLAEWAALSFVAGRCRMPGVRLILQRVEEALFAPGMHSLRHVTGCRAIAAVVIEQGQPRSRIHAGIVGELFCLEAAAMGLATCWQTEGWRENLMALPLRSYESLLCVIALGHAKGYHAAAHDRKPLRDLCRGTMAQWPAEYQAAAELVRKAPSEGNLQPWQLEAEANRFVIHAADPRAPEVGVAALHAELAFTAPHTWSYARGAWQPAAWCVK